MDKTPRPIRKILVATGLTMESVGAVEVARWLWTKLGVEGHAVHVIQPVSDEEEAAIPGLAASHMKLAEEELGRFAESHGLTEAAQLHVGRGNLPSEVLKVRRAIDADLLVFGRYGRGGLKQGSLGRNAEMLVRKCQVSVLVVPPEFRGEFARIGVASDLSDEAGIGIRRALQLGATLGLKEIVLLHTYCVPRGYHTILTWEEACERLEKVARQRAEEVVAGAAAETPGAPPVRIVIEQGAAGATLPKLAKREGLDLLVMATHGRSSAALLLLGNTTEKLVRSAPCSVWAEKSPSLFQGFMEAMKELLDY